MYQLEEKIWFWGLIVIPLIVLVFLLLQLWKRRMQLNFASKSSFKRLSPNTSFFKSMLKAVVLSLAFTCLVIALVNPKLGTKLQTVKREGVDIVFPINF